VKGAPFIGPFQVVLDVNNAESGLIKMVQRDVCSRLGKRFITVTKANYTLLLVQL
jgi:hypothetical protein